MASLAFIPYLSTLTNACRGAACASAYGQDLGDHLALVTHLLDMGANTAVLTADKKEAAALSAALGKIPWDDANESKGGAPCIPLLTLLLERMDVKAGLHPLETLCDMTPPPVDLISKLLARGARPVGRGIPFRCTAVHSLCRS
jgi:hypothetical protein